ncbi:MAG: hypothetical protein DRN66_03200 [Candidatus Nanohalarchaeota archaeon]|nr:MAG: hypothetical protein DRN66_03200 [Candidatus Nanohaloarchaeota archaeon]
MDISEEMYRLNYKIMLVGDGEKITGVLTEEDILKAILKFGY